MSEPSNPHLGIAGRIAAAFIDSKLTPLVVIASVLLGVAAIVLLPREEEPQIKVPMVDVMVAMPGSTAKEIEERATRPMEKLLWEVPGVEYLYSTSRDSESLVIVRFKVGEDPERSLVKITEKLRSNFDRIPMGVTMPIVKPKSIDDVPILALTFHSARYDHLTLRRLAAQVDESIKQVPLVAETTLLGGSRRAVRVMLDPVKLASRNLSPAGLVPMSSRRTANSAPVDSMNRTEVQRETSRRGRNGARPAGIAAAARWWLRPVLGAAAALWLLLAPTAWADTDLPTKFSNIGTVGNTRHNLSQRQTSGGGPSGQTMDSFRNDYTEVCVYCHTRHGANTTVAAPLWNRTMKATTYTTYDLLQTSSLTQPVSQPGVNSLTCLSCHDGQTAVDSVINMPGSGRYLQSQETSENSAFLNSWNNTRGPDATVHARMSATECLAYHSAGAGIVGGGATDLAPLPNRTTRSVVLIRWGKFSVLHGTYEFT